MTMDEKKIKEILSRIESPEADKDKKNQHINAAMAAFEAEQGKENQKKTQGSRQPQRLTDIAVKKLNNIGRNIMKKRYVASGITGGVAVCALLAVLGMPFIQQQMERTGGGSVQYETAPVDARNIGNVSDNIVTPKENLDPAYKAAIERKSKQGADVAEAMGGTFLPTPIRPSRELSAIAAPSKPQGKALSHWRASPADEGSGGFLATPIGDAESVTVKKTVGEDEFADFEENAIKQVSDHPVSTFSVDVDTASYSFVRRMLNKGMLPQKDAVRVEELINYFDYDYPVAESKDRPFKPTVAVYDSPWKEGNKIVHIGIRGYDIQAAKKPETNLVFLIDTSGSMRAQDKLPLLKNSFKLLLSNLEPDDTVGIVTYAGSAGVVLEPTKASEGHKIMSALDNLRSGGATAGAAGIKAAYGLAQAHMKKDGVNRVILATDGDFNVGITNHEELQDYVERMRDTGVSLSVLGFGQGNYHDNLMQTLAQNGNGNAAYIDNLNEARKVLVEQASATLFTIAKDVKIQVEFNPARVAEYRLVGYETRALKREDFNNDKVDAGEIGSGHRVTAIYEITPVGGNKMVDDLRYSDKLATEKMEPAQGEEYAFLRIRYKQPDSDTSQLMERPITIADEKPFTELSNDIRFANSVAGFGQLLKGGKYTGDLTYDDVIDMANDARGKDEFGYRSEFVNLVRLAKSASAMPDNQ